MNSTGTVPATLGVEAIEEVGHFTYWGASLIHRVELKQTLKPGSARLGKVRVAFLQLKNI